MKFLIFAVFGFLLDVEVWSLECWAADYEECKVMKTIDEIFDCAKHREKKGFEKGECEKCGRATATFIDKSKVELRFCNSESDDCEDIRRLIEGHETERKELSKEIECSFCNNAPLCNDPDAKRATKSKNEDPDAKRAANKSKNEDPDAKRAAKSKNGSGIQNRKFSNIFILVTIVLTILTAF